MPERKQKQISAFTYTQGSKVAFVKHHNIKNASLRKRELVAKELHILGIRKISTSAKYLTVKKFLGLNSEK